MKYLLHLHEDTENLPYHIAKKMKRTVLAVDAQQLSLCKHHIKMKTRNRPLNYSSQKAYLVLRGILPSGQSLRGYICSSL